MNTNSLNNRIPILLLLVSAVILLEPAAARACSTFVLNDDGVLLVGHNLDEEPGFFVPGMIWINQRGVRKEGITWAELVKPPCAEDTLQVAPVDSDFTWVSRYGSVTVNTDGLEFPDWGINEAGLVVCEMGLSSTRFAVEPDHPTLFMSTWIQYQLDNYASVRQVIENAHLINLDGWTWHYMVADSSGASGVIEFIDGKVLTYMGQDLPVPALCNASYADELARLEKLEAPGAMNAIKDMFSRTPRFVKAARMLADFDGARHPSPLEYGWDILENTRIRGWNKWSILVDVRQGMFYFNTARNREIRKLSLKGIDFSPGRPSRMLDIHTELTGDIAAGFTDYTFERNLEFLVVRSGIIFRERLKSLMDIGLTSEWYARRFARHADKIQKLCVTGPQIPVQH